MKSNYSGLIMEEQPTSQNTTENEQEAVQESEVEETQESGKVLTD